jgi:alanyl-tRNA synthetase
VNEKIRENIAVQIGEMPKDEAIAMGAMALFGEKYSDLVRVVVMDKSYSIELCGGTHVAATGELGYFKLKHESAVAAGVRRIEAISGAAAAGWLQEQLGQLHQVKELLKHPKELPKAIEATLHENAQLRKQLESLENRALVGIRNELLLKKELVNGINFVGDIVEVSNADALKKLSYDLKAHLGNCIAVLSANIGGKPFVAISIADELVASGNWDAGKLIREVIAPLIKGGGGGQKNLATAGGQDAGRLGEVITAVKHEVSSKQ